MKKHHNPFRTHSKELTKQETFVHAHRKHHNSVCLMRFLILLIFLAVWEFCTYTGIIDGFFFSSPSMVVSCFIDMLVSGNLFLHLSVTLAETVVSFLLVILFGIAAASLLWFSPSASEIAEPYLVVLNSLPKSALAPLFIVWLGTGMTTIIVAGISVAVFGCVISLYTGFKQIDAEKTKLIYTLGGTKWDVYKKVILPGSVPTILSTMKVNIGLALVGVIIGEFLAARRGLGYLIIYGSQVFQLNMVITSIIILCIIAMGLYKIIQKLEHYHKKKL